MKNLKINLIACFIIFSITMLKSQTYMVNTITGNSVTPGYSGDGGPAIAATFSNISSAITDMSGNIYISDELSHCIRKINQSTGIITTIAGNGTQGYTGDGGPASLATLSYPLSLVLNPAGNAILFVDQSYSRIRKIDLISGNISTIIGSGSNNFSVGLTAASCSFSGAKSLTYNSTGDLFILFASTGNCNVYRVDKTTDLISKYVGTGGGWGYSFGDGGLATSAAIDLSGGIVFDGSDNLYIAEQQRDKIRKVNSAGIISTLAGGISGFAGDGGPAAAAQFKVPSSVCIDNNNNLIIDDPGNYRIRSINLSTGIINTLMGNGVYGATGDGGATTLAKHAGGIVLSSLYGNVLYANNGTNLREIKLNGSSNQIFGNVFVDCNNNCTKQSNETYASSAVQLIATTGSSSYTVSPNAYGNYSFSGLPSGLYTILPVALTNYSLCSSASFTANITPTTNISYNFAVKQTSAPTSDYTSFLTLSGASPGPGAVPGGTITLSVYNNMMNASACTTVSPGKLKIVLPPFMTYGIAVGTTTAPNSIVTAATGDTLIWNSPAPNDVHQFTAITATNVLIGGSYCISSIIYPLADAVPGNNTFTFCRTYGGPFDPNDKTAEALGMSANGNILPATTDLTYTIRFQNMGSAPAVNVLVKDTIDLNLNINSIQILSSSYPVQAQINNSTREVSFRFNTIYLPAASVNEPASHGYVRYKINLNSGLPLGTIIKNRGQIYFDYNSAVATNQTINTIVATGIKESELSKTISVYPNPTNGHLNITSSVMIIKIEVINTVGQLEILHEGVNYTEGSVDVSRLAQGVYILQLFTTQGVITKKIIRE